MKISSRGDKTRKSGQICARDQLDNVWEIVWLEQTRGGGKPENNKLHTRLMLHFLSNRRKKWIRKKKYFILLAGMTRKKKCILLNWKSVLPPSERRWLNELASYNT